MKKAVCILSILLGLSACAKSATDTQPSTDGTQTENPFIKEPSEQEKNASMNKWNSSQIETRLQDYKGTTVRVQVLLGDSDVREMRLKLIQNASGGDVDGNMQDVLAKVADFEMKKVCGSHVESIDMVYEKPSFDAVRPSPFFDYKMQTAGDAMREYGFRCVYHK